MFVAWELIYADRSKRDKGPRQITWKCRACRLKIKVLNTTWKVELARIELYTSVCQTAPSYQTRKPAPFFSTYVYLVT